MSNKAHQIKKTDKNRNFLLLFEAEGYKMVEYSGFFVMEKTLPNGRVVVAKRGNNFHASFLTDANSINHYLLTYSSRFYFPDFDKDVKLIIKYVGDITDRVKKYGTLGYFSRRIETEDDTIFVSREHCFSLNRGFLEMSVNK